MYKSAFLFLKEIYIKIERNIYLAHYIVQFNEIYKYISMCVGFVCLYFYKFYFFFILKVDFLFPKSFAQHSQQVPNFLRFFFQICLTYANIMRIFI